MHIDRRREARPEQFGMYIEVQRIYVGICVCVSQCRWQVKAVSGGKVEGSHSMRSFLRYPGDRLLPNFAVYVKDVCIHVLACMLVSLRVRAE